MSNPFRPTRSWSGPRKRTRDNLFVKRSTGTSDVGFVGMSVLAGVIFWLGSQPLFMGCLAYHKFWLGEGQGYEGGLFGFLGGMFIWGLFFATPPAGVFFFAVFVGLMLSRKRISVNPVLLYVFSGVLGLSWPLLVIVFMGIDGGM